jgi:hypothetical protein
MFTADAGSERTHCIAATDPLNPSRISPSLISNLHVRSRCKWRSYISSRVVSSQGCRHRDSKVRIWKSSRFLRALDDALTGQSTTDIPAPLRSSAVYYFGICQKANVAAKKDRAMSPKGRITTTLSRMHRQKQSCSGTNSARNSHLAAVYGARGTHADLSCGLLLAGDTTSVAT